MTNYAEWIDAYELRGSERVMGEKTEADRRRVNVTGRCWGATEQMVEDFPELRRVRGHYGGRAHWWCVAPDGTIVDPTKRQFDYEAEYVEYTGPDPIGQCDDCGGYIWESDGYSYGDNYHKECR